ncbi:hypothetical protein PtA15_9A655 [Puccinia triticina]|uniref:RING-type domain-containing protein n=1 Tax=Puccinia triticina TaxID=208348 RepID=A0ABY7CW08_9BASI|nr:uncharacterized protein PtA15_9A655 [Puccinia triticina]WAQ88528.1 hypothetical protein PtA15_9A655 [Puccinia triticina]
MNHNPFPGDLDAAEILDLGPSSSREVCQTPSRTRSLSHHGPADGSEMSGNPTFPGTTSAHLPELRDNFATDMSVTRASTSSSYSVIVNEHISGPNEMLGADDELEDFEEPDPEIDAGYQAPPPAPVADGNAPPSPSSAENQLRVQRFFRDLQESFRLMIVTNTPVPRHLAVHEIEELLDRLQTTTAGPSRAENSDEQAVLASCSICLEDDVEGDTLFVLPCHASHRFHRICLQDWLQGNTSCPLCRASLRISETEEPI